MTRVTTTVRAPVATIATTPVTTTFRTPVTTIATTPVTTTFRTPVTTHVTPTAATPVPALVTTPVPALVTTPVPALVTTPVTTHVATSWNTSAQHKNIHNYILLLLYFEPRGGRCCQYIEMGEVFSSVDSYPRSPNLNPILRYFIYYTYKNKNKIIALFHVMNST